MARRFVVYGMTERKNCARRASRDGGCIISTVPTGHTYTTRPGCTLFFPSLTKPTGELWTDQPPTVETTAARGVMMPRRRNTRSHNTVSAITAERRLNDTRVAERNKPQPF